MILIIERKDCQDSESIFGYVTKEETAIELCKKLEENTKVCKYCGTKDSYSWISLKELVDVTTKDLIGDRHV